MAKRAPRKPLVLIDSPFRNEEGIFRLKRGKYSSIESDAWLAELKRFLERQGYRVATVAHHDLAEADHILFLDAVVSDPVLREFRRRRNALKARASLVTIDAAVVNQYEHTERALRLFDRVLTWDPARIDNRKFFHYHLPESFFRKDPFRIPFRGKKFLCMINGNKLSLFPTELYSERKRAARFFERTPEGIDVYGAGWDRRPAIWPIALHATYRWRYLVKSLLTLDLRPYANLFGHILNRPRLLRKTVKGRIEESSVAVYARYKFAICFENARDIPGYATEKLFNCLNARCVPVYWGDSEILRHVPKGCYIDLREFDNCSDLYAFLKAVDGKRYARYMKEINAFLRTAEKGPYGIPAFVHAVYDSLIKD